MFPAIDPSKYLDFAQEIASRSEPEVIRTVADRAYYSAFLFCRDQLAEKGYITPYYNTEDHRYVPAKLKELLGSFGNDENRLRTHRNRVTYDTREVTDSPSIDWMIETARKIIERVKTLPVS